MEPMDSAVDAGRQDASVAASAAATAAAAVALQVLAAQPPTDTGQCRCIYGKMNTSEHRRNSHCMMLMCVVHAAV